MSFGKVLSETRKERGVSQKELASLIKKEDGNPISPQYLNDLERDRRNPPSEFLLKQLARELGLDQDYLFYVAQQYPEDLHDGSIPPDRVAAAFQAFRRVLNPS